MTSRYIATGKLTNARTLSLDEPLPVSSGKVRVTVEVVPPAGERSDILSVMEKIWDDQRRRGHIPPTTEEVEARIRAERESWSD